MMLESRVADRQMGAAQGMRLTQDSMAKETKLGRADLTPEQALLKPTLPHSALLLRDTLRVVSQFRPLSHGALKATSPKHCYFAR